MVWLFLVIDCSSFPSSIVRISSPIKRSLNSLFSSFSSNLKVKRNVDSIKSDLLKLVYQAQHGTRGSKATEEEKMKIEELFNELESSHGQNETLSRKALNAVWKLEYTTSVDLSGQKGFPRVGPVLQTVNANELSAENKETISVWNLFNFSQRVTAKLIPQTATQVEVQFLRFFVGPVSFPAPSTAKGTLNITFVDKDLRLSRGNKGNIFILTRFGDLS